MKISDRTDEELEDLAEKALARLAKVAEEFERRTCDRCGAGEVGGNVNAMATEFHAAVLTAKAAGTRLALMMPGIQPQFGGK